MTTFTLPAQIRRETDKALLVAVELEHAAKRFGREVWLPKSQITNNDDTIEVPVWLGRAKVRELAERAGFRSSIWFVDAPHVAS